MPRLLCPKYYVHYWTDEKNVKILKRSEYKVRISRSSITVFLLQWVILSTAWGSAPHFQDHSSRDLDIVCCKTPRSMQSDMCFPVRYSLLSLMTQLWRRTWYTITDGTNFPTWRNCWTGHWNPACVGKTQYAPFSSLPEGRAVLI